MFSRFRVDMKEGEVYPCCYRWFSWGYIEAYDLHYPTRFYIGGKLPSYQHHTVQHPTSDSFRTGWTQLVWCFRFGLPWNDWDGFVLFDIDIDNHNAKYRPYQDLA